MKSSKIIKSMAVVALMTTTGVTAIASGATDASAKTTVSKSRAKNVKVISKTKVKKANYYAKNTSGWAYSPTKYYRYFQLKEHAKDTYTVDQKMYINDKGVKELYFHVIDNSNKKVKGWVWNRYLAKGVRPNASAGYTKESFSASKMNSAVMSGVNSRRSAMGVKAMTNHSAMATIAKVRANELTKNFVSKGTVYASGVADDYGFDTPQAEIVGKVTFTGNNKQTANAIVTDAVAKRGTTLLNGEDIHTGGIGTAQKGNTIYYAMELQPEA